MPRPLLLALLLAAAPAAAQAPSVEPARRVHPDSVRILDADEVVPLGDVVVTATRTARALEDVPVPTTVIPAEDIRARGVRRLGDLLAEQAGLVIADGIGGAGLQVQGFDPDYTLILLDGEPVIGRTAGTLAMDRLAVTGVERVEVVRGPLSARYGSDALAGVVNLVTRRPGGAPTARFAAHAESHGTTDLSVEAEAGTERVGARLFLNRYGSDGYSARPETGTLTVPAFSDYSADLRATLRPGDATTVDVGARVARQELEGAFTLSGLLYDERSDRTDWSLSPTVRHRFSRRLTAEASGHVARFDNAIRSAERVSGALFDDTAFTHDYRKAEGGLTWLPAAGHVAYVGGGWIGERVGGDRYVDERAATQPYAYAEYDWRPGPRLDVVASARYDAPSDYAARLTPKAAVLARPLDWLRLRASVGSGYKAPDFRQRYLSFANATAGYTVYGAEEALAGIEALQAAGGIERLLLPLDALGPLRAEGSTAYGLGAEAQLGPAVTLRADLFHNEVRDLIDTQPVAVKTNGQSVFTYFNLDRVYTRGVEAALTWIPVPELTVRAGYQLLDTADRDVLEAIAAGTLFRRDAAGRDVRVTRADYGGLLGRSRHAGSLAADYRLAALGLTTSARVVWRSRYGYADLNGNAVIDEAREYAPGHALVHLTASKTLGRADLQAGVRNLLGHTDAERLPTEPGRVLFVGAGYRF